MITASKSTKTSRWTWDGKRFTRQKPSQRTQQVCKGVQLYHRARYFDPTTGEFTSIDPLGYVDGMSLYRGYMELWDVDPLGTETIRSYCQRKCSKFDPNVWPNNKKDFRTRQRLQFAYDYCLGECVNNPERRGLLQLEELLKASCRDCLCDKNCSIDDCHVAAKRVAAAVYHTLRENYRFTLPTLVIQIGPYVIYKPTNHLHKGYYCYEWAYGLKSAVNSVGGECFRARFNGARLNKNSNLVHAWVAIKLKCSNRAVAYVDDAFSNEEDIFVHEEQPNCNFEVIGDPCVRRNACNPVTPYDEEGNPIDLRRQ